MINVKMWQNWRELFRSGECSTEQTRTGVGVWPRRSGIPFSTPPDAKRPCMIIIMSLTMTMSLAIAKVNYVSLSHNHSQNTKLEFNPEDWMGGSKKKLIWHSFLLWERSEGAWWWYSGCYIALIVAWTSLIKCSPYPAWQFHFSLNWYFQKT